MKFTPPRSSHVRSSPDLKFWLGGLILLLAVQGAWAGQALTAEEAFKQSDAIAYIKIDDIHPFGGDGKYGQTAEAEVYEPIKGLKSNERFDLDFDNGSSDSNVQYRTDEKALVVLRKLSNGHYETMHDYSGKFTVEQGEVLDCYLLGEPGKIPQSVAVDDAVRRLRILVAAAKE